MSTNTIPNRNEPVVIASACDDNYAMPLAVTLFSALSNLSHSREVAIYIIDGGIRRGSRRHLERVIASKREGVRIFWVRADLSVLEDLPTSAWHSRSAYLRLLLPTLMPQHVRRVIYLDCDLVVEGDLNELWTADMSESLAMAAQDSWSPFVELPEALGTTYRNVGLQEHTPYCNTGVMVIDLLRWREQDVAAQVIAYTRQYEDTIRFADQDGINAVVAGRWTILDPRWNVSLSTIGSYGRWLGISEEEMERERDRQLQSPLVLHYTGRVKPWHLGHYRGPAQARFFHYLRESGWYGPLGWLGLIVHRRSRWMGSMVKHRVQAAVNRLHRAGHSAC